MWSLVLLVLLTALLYLWLRKISSRNAAKLENEYERTGSEYKRLLEKNAGLKQENAFFEKNAERMVALYEITKDVCRFLDEDKVFTAFKEKVHQFVERADYRFLKDKKELANLSGYSVLPLKIDKHIAGYLAIGPIKAEEQDTFHILTQQLMLGIKRALLYQKIQEIAITDNLTGVLSRRYCLDRFREEIERSKKFQYGLSCLMFDIDHFKELNDRYGHLVGDMVLREVGKVVKMSVRLIDLVGRYGGEEFCACLAETDKEGARLAAERIRQAIASQEFKAYDERLRITVSIGVSTFPADAQNMEPLIEKADAALYRAKELGRNKVCVYEARK